MNRCFRIVPIFVLMILADPNFALAGMPSVSLSDLASMRLQTISFFLVVFLFCSWVFRWLWNSARKDFHWLPYLNYGRAAGLVALWGFLFVLILTMISGARELLTPGAWTKDGLTYKLKVPAELEKSIAIDRDADRRSALDRLRIALWTYARHHDGHFPATDSPPEIPDETWRVPDPSGMKYRYTAGFVADGGHSPLAYEPGLFGKDRFVLLTDGKIVSMNEDELLAATGKAP
jgi:hypothetical protein